MKKFFVTLMILLLCSFPVFSQETAGGQVTIPLDQFLKLMNKGGKTTTYQMPAPPVKMVFGTANLTGTFLGDALKVEARLPFELYDGSWNEITFIGTGAAISKAAIDGQDMSVYAKELDYAILFKGKGRHTLEFVYLVPVQRKGNSTTANLLLPPSPSSNLTLIVRKTGVKIQASSSMGGSSVERDSSTVFTSTVPVSEQTIVSWTLNSPPKSSGGQVVNYSKPKIYSQVYNLVSVNVGAVRVTSIVNLSVLRGQTNSFSFLLPKDVELLDVKSDKLQDRTVEDGKNGKEVTVYLTDKVEGDQQVTVTYEKPLKDVNSTWGVPFIKVIGAEQDKGFVACETTSSLSMEQAVAQDITRIDVKELPSALSNLASTPVMLSYRYYKHPCVLDIQTERHEEIAVLAATIDNAQAMTFVNDDGISITKVIYQMKNNMQQFLEVKLPEGGEILNAFVAGNPVKPVKPSDAKDKKTVLIPLKKSSNSGNTAPDTFAVEISYKNKSNPFSFLGQERAFLPSCNVMISEYYWTIYLPEDNRIVSFSGNMKKGRPGSVNYDNRRMEEIVGMKRDAEVYNEKTEGGEKPSVAVDKAKQQVMIQNFASSSIADESGRVSGILPVQLYIPQSGQVYYFHKSLLENGTVPVVKVTYIGGYILKIFCWITLLISLWLMIRMRKLGINKANLITVFIFFLITMFVGNKIAEIYSFSKLGIFLGVVYLFITSEFIKRLIPSFKKKQVFTEEDFKNEQVVRG